MSPRHRTNAAVAEPEAPDAPKGRRNNFDFLRLFLAILVIFSHSYPLGTGSEKNEPFVRLTRGQTTGGTIAVDLFFVMSGYLITASFLRSDGVLDYLGKRVRRIYPGFTVSMLLSTLFVIPFSGGILRAFHPAGRIGIVLGKYIPMSGSILTGVGGQILNFVGSTLMLREPLYNGAFKHNPFPDAINGSVWTIPFEFLCYLGLMILGVTGLLSRRRLLSGFLLGAIAVSVACNALHPHIRDTWLGFVLGNPLSWAKLLPMYLSGVVAYLFRDQVRYNWKGGVASLFAILGACFIPYAWYAVFPPAGAYILFWVAFNPGIRLHRAARFGDFSYGTYLYAFPIQQTIAQAWGRPMNPLALFALATPITLAFAVASWHLVEHRFLNLKRKPDGAYARDAS